MKNKELQEKINRLEKELVKMKKEVETLPSNKRGVFKPKYGGEYWLIEHDGEVSLEWWEDFHFDDDVYSIGNCFPTKQLAKDTIRVLKLVQKAKESQNGFVPDWENGIQDKYLLYYGMENIFVINYNLLNLAPMFGFWEEEKTCRKFIRENQDELIWFFTEYGR